MHFNAATIVRRTLRAEEGQGTVEYILVVLAAAAMATALLGWVGKTSLIPTFFNSVIRFVTGMIG